MLYLLRTKSYVMENINNEQVVIYDFDKTITSIDTFTRLIMFLINESIFRQCFSLLFLPAIYSLKYFNVTKSYAASLGLWVASVGITRRCLIEKIKRYSDQRKTSGTHDVMRKYALESIKRHLSHGHSVVIASASSKLWIKHILGTSISSQVTIVGSKLHYKWNGLTLKSWCYGKEKLEHFEQYGVPQQNLRTIYSDCITDIVLMERARNRCFVNLPANDQRILEGRGKFYFLDWPY